MPLSRTDRFKLKSRILLEITDDESPWDFRQQNLLLNEFGRGSLDRDGGWNGPSFEDLITDINDGDLLAIYEIVTGQQPDGAIEADGGASNWKPGYVRLFISHSAVHKAFIGEVANELAIVGIHGFVAHDTMEYSKSWQTQIEQALKSMDAFVAVIHPEFLESAWCHQEVGWALGRRVPNFAVRVGSDPAGFISREQWPSAFGLDARAIAAQISAWASSIPELGETMTDGLFSALAEANNYMDAGATATRVATLSDLTRDQWERLALVFWSNDQVYGGILPRNALEPFYRRHGRDFPPPRPDGPSF